MSLFSDAALPFVFTKDAVDTVEAAMLSTNGPTGVVDENVDGDDDGSSDVKFCCC